MSKEIEGRYAGYSTPELFELARAGESRFRPDAWQSLKDELRKRGLELTPEDEALAVGSATETETASDSAPTVGTGIDGWLLLFVVMMGLSVLQRTYQTVAAFIALSWIGVFYGLHAVILVIGLVLVYHRDPLAPRFWRDVLILTAGLTAFFGVAHLMDLRRALLMAAVLIGWAAYWQTSRRVRARFATVHSTHPATEVDVSAASSIEELDGSLTEAESDAEPVPSIEELNAELDDARRQGNFAVVYIVMGLAVTIGTYYMALTAGGGTYTIAWGAVAFGMYGAARANGRKKRVRALLERASVVVRSD